LLTEHRAVSDDAGSTEHACWHQSQNVFIHLWFCCHTVCDSRKYYTHKTVIVVPSL